MMTVPNRKKRNRVLEPAHTSPLIRPLSTVPGTHGATFQSPVYV
jgi:hypothetical protein